MIPITYTVDARQVERLKEAFNVKFVNRVLRRAINETANTARSRIVKGIVEQINLRQKFVRSDRVLVARPKGFDLTAAIAISDKPVPLREFLGSESRAARLVNKGGPGQPKLSIQVRKGKREVFSRAFVTRVRGTGQIGVFKRYGDKKRISSGPRAGKEAQALTLMRGPTIAGTFLGVKALEARTMKDIGDLLEKNVARNVDNALAGIGGFDKERRRSFK